MPEPSLKFTTVRVLRRMQTSNTEYISGRNSRREYRECRGSRADPEDAASERYEYGPLRALIENRDLHNSYQLDLEAMVYTATRVNDFGAPVWMKPRRVEMKSSGRTRYIHIETVDTGERRQMFGYTGRRVVTRKSDQTEPQDTVCVSESETDGWYIDPPAAWLILHPPRPGVCYLGIGGLERDDVKITATGPRETGFALLATHTHRSTISGATHTHVHHEKVTEFSEDPLDPDLFLPPASFKRVPQLPAALSGFHAYPLGIRLRLRWEILKDALRLGLATARRG
jgi:hypothetical protein